MRAMIPVMAAALAMAIPAASEAQQVSVDVGIRQGPVTGRVIIGDPYYHYSPARVYVAPRVIVVRRFHRGHGWYRNHGYRPVVVWYDYGRDRWYDRYDRRLHGLHRVEVFERGGRYYTPDDWRRDRYDGRDRGHYDARNDYEGRVWRDRDRD